MSFLHHLRRNAHHFEYTTQEGRLRKSYVFGIELLPQPEFPKPLKGVPYFDPSFGVKVTRISDRTIYKLGYWSKKEYGSLMHPSYPKHNYDNSDGTYLLFNGSFESGQVLYDARSFKLIKSLSTKAVNWNQTIDARWDAHNPEMLYYYFSPPTALCQYNVRTDQFKIVHDFIKDFPGATSITMEEEGDCSYDSRYFAFLLRAPRGGDKWAHEAVFCYDRVEDKIVGKIDSPYRGLRGKVVETG